MRWLAALLQCTRLFAQLDRREGSLLRASRGGDRARRARAGRDALLGGLVAHVLQLAENADEYTIENTLPGCPSRSG
jgi:hypothetical protein